MTSGWSWFIIIVSLANIAGAYWLLRANGQATIPSRSHHVAFGLGFGL